MKALIVNAHNESKNGKLRANDFVETVTKVTLSISPFK